MSEQEQRILIEKFLNAQLLEPQRSQFFEMIDRDQNFREILDQEIELIEALSPGGNYQSLKQRLKKAQQEHFEGGKS